jgi:superfamily II DNA or RNA helicase
LERVNDVALVRFKERNALITAWAKYYSEVRNFPTLVVATRTLHIYILESLIKKAIGDDKVQILIGDHTTKQRNTAFDWFRHTPGGVLISPLVQEGVSINEIRGGVIADHITDWERANQIIGRFIRKKEHDNEAHITFIFDNQHKTLRSGSKEVLFKLMDIRGYTFAHPVIGPETLKDAKVYKTTD